MVFVVRIYFVRVRGTPSTYLRRLNACWTIVIVERLHNFSRQHLEYLLCRILGGVVRVRGVSSARRKSLSSGERTGGSCTPGCPMGRAATVIGIGLI